MPSATAVTVAVVAFAVAVVEAVAVVAGLSAGSSVAFGIRTGPCLVKAVGFDCRSAE